MRIFLFGLIIGLASVPFRTLADGPITVGFINNQSMSSSFNSTSIDLLYKELASVQASWTCPSGCSGNLNLSVSNDNVNFSTYTGSNTTVNGSGNFVWNMLFVGFRYVQVVYTANSGSGTLNGRLVAKGN